MFIFLLFFNEKQTIKMHCKSEPEDYLNLVFNTTEPELDRMMFRHNDSRIIFNSLARIVSGTFSNINSPLNLTQLDFLEVPQQEITPQQPMPEPSTPQRPRKKKVVRKKPKKVAFQKNKKAKRKLNFDVWKGL